MYKDMMIKVGEYTNNAGETKGEWVKVGVVGENQNGQFFMLDPSVNIAGLLIKQRLFNSKTKDMVMGSIFEDRQAKGAGFVSREEIAARQRPASPSMAAQAPSPQAAAEDPFDDTDIPF